MAVRQKDIADVCGVSIAAVSKVLANHRHPEFPEETRRRILETARRMHYLPNRLAANLRKGRTASISLISAWNVSELQDSVALAARERELGMILQFSKNNDHDAVAQAVENVLCEQPAGLIWLPGWGNENCPQRNDPNMVSIREKVHRIGCPVVWLEDEPPWIENCDFVWCADQDGINKAVDHLYEQGYRNLIFTTAQNVKIRLSPRWPLFEQAAQERGCEAHLLKTGKIAKTFDSVIHKFLRECPDNTAFLCESDWRAVPILHSAKQLERNIPEEIGIMVFGDLHLGGGFSIGEVTHPTLSAIRRPFDSIGEQAVRLLNQRISDQYKGPSRRSILPIELIVRESTVRNKKTQSEEELPMVLMEEQK